MITSPIQLFKPYQRAVYDDASRFIAWVAGRQVGKSFTGGGRAVKFANTVPKTDFLIASPSERQSFEAVLKCRDWAEAFDFAIADVLEERDAPGALMKAATIVFPNKSRIIAVPGKPDTVRGYSAHVWMDEFAFFEDPDATWKAILPSISNPLKGLKTAFITSTPNGKSGRGKRFYEIVTNKGAIDPETAGAAYRAGAWSIHRTPITLAAPFLGTDVEELRQAVDDEEAWEQEFLCRFIDGSSVLLPYDLMAKCESYEAAVDTPLEELQARRRAGSRFFAGFDFGRVNDPSVLWLYEKLGDVLWTRLVKVIRATNTVDQFEICRPYIALCDKVCIDYTGPGVGFGDLCEKEFGASRDGSDPVRCELCVFSPGFKREIFPKFRTAVGGARVRLPVDVECREDLHEMQDVVKGDAHNYFAKRTAEGHSDRCTAGALGNRAASFGTSWTFYPVVVAPDCGASGAIGTYDNFTSRKLD